MRLICRKSSRIAISSAMLFVQQSALPLPARAAPSFTTLYNFAMPLNHKPSTPAAGLIFGPKGSFYGVTSYGGRSEFGTVFQLMKTRRSWQVNELYAFGSQNEDGLRPEAGATLGPDGKLYGTNSVGGQYSWGTVYALSRSKLPGGGWEETVLHIFGSGSDGQYPFSGVVIGPNGTLYGMTLWGGTADVGTVFELAPPAALGDAWTETVLHDFTGSLSGPSGDGAWPMGNLLIGNDGELYGSTNYGGSGNCPYTCGTVFKLTPPKRVGGTWSETIVYNFNGQPNDGQVPFSGLTMGADGALFGTTYYGGPFNDCLNGCGTVYALKPPERDKDNWTETVLHEFTSDNLIDGINPIAGLAIGKDGALFGTTENGGAQDYYCGTYCGTVFELAPSMGGAWSETVLHNFTDENGDGEGPQGTLIIGKHDMLYGTTPDGGAYIGGTAFEWKP